ncbi:MAG: DUF1404 family protein [Rhodobacteraceae bacterium]|nr:DUF1404 family protein [Paracoccaceae bacterium]
MRARTQAAIGAGLVLLALLPPVAGRLEARLPLQVLGQYPLLVAGGALAGAALARRHGRGAGWSAAAALLAGAAVLGFWMIPRWIDAAVALPSVRTLRALSLVLAAGLPLGWGWALAGPVLRGFALANAVPMLAVTGWILLVVPARLCNSFLVEDQRLLGRLQLALALAILVAAVLRALAGGPAQGAATDRRMRRASPPIASPQAPRATNTSPSGIGSRKP